MSEYTERVFVTKWALTGGILELGARHHSDNYYSLEGRDGLYVMGRDFFPDRLEAEEALNAARRDRIESLKKQIAKLEKAIAKSEATQ